MRNRSFARWIPGFSALVLASLATFSPFARAQPGGELLWTDQFDLAGENDSADDVVARGNQVFVVGVTGADCPLFSFSPSDDCDFLLRAYDRATGAVQWTDTFDLSGGRDRALAVQVEGRRVFAAGLSANGSGDFASIVRAYDARTGELLWDDRPDAGKEGFAFRVAVHASRVFVAGASGDGCRSAGECQTLIRAYDAATGMLLWSDAFGPVRAGGGRFVAASGDSVFVAATGEDAGGRFDFHLRAYDAHTGALLWAAETATADADERAFDLAASGGRVFVVGDATNPTGSGGFPADQDFLVRAYDARTGGLLWSDQVDGAGRFDLAQAVAVQGWRVYAAGFISEQSRDFAVRAYDASTGTLFWEDRFELAGRADAAADLVVAGRQVFAVGAGRNATGGDFDLLVRAYDGQTGAVVWADQLDVAGGDDFAAPTLSGLAVYGNRLIVTGQGTNAAANSDGLVRVYKTNQHGRDPSGNAMALP